VIAQNVINTEKTIQEHCSWIENIRS